MGRIKKDFTLYRRQLRDGRMVWYYRTYTEDGRRTPGCSTGCTLKTKAEKHCNKLLKDGKLIPAAIIERGRIPTLREWAESEKWWVWDECKYIHRRLRRDKAKPAVSQRYADDALRDLHTYILPAHGAKPLDRITTGDCEDLLTSLEEQGLSDKSILNKVSVERIMLAEAERLGKIERNPWDRVEAFKPNSRRKGILSTEEARALLNPATVATVWAGNMLYYCASLLSAFTACRLGEVLALTRGDLFPDHIHVGGSWGRRYGKGPTKTKRVDDVPIPGFVFRTIDAWCTWDGYIFSYNRGRKPCEASRVNDALKAAIAEIGITEEERARRNVTFHGWRYWLNTTLRGRGVTGEKVREITRHDSEEMTEHYSAWRAEDFKDVAAIQEELAAGIQKATK